MVTIQSSPPRFKLFNLKKGNLENPESRILIIN